MEAKASTIAEILSPKLQRTIRINDAQLIMLSERARDDHTCMGYLHKRSGDSSKWQIRWFVLYQNLLFYYDTESCHRPSGVVLLEGCYCERLMSVATTSKFKDLLDLEHAFAISYRRQSQRQYELRAPNEDECKVWIDAIKDASFNKLLLQKEELEQKHLHLLQIVESEKTAKWQYTQQCDELAAEIKKLKVELIALKREYKPSQTTEALPVSLPKDSSVDVSDMVSYVRIQEDPNELRKIKKVQSFFRGWLCRRRWKQIVEQYIKSPHAESMRKRNCLVFRMVESEEEYMEQMEVLVSCFFRPFKMAASSKKPPCTHEEVNSIFLNSETVLFLHQIFLKGLTSRLEHWPTLVLGDLFTMLLPMLHIYQDYVRNHHYSLQVLTECKQVVAFAALLKKLENKPSCHGRSLETFLTYPMHQVPRYIITLHELLAHTPHDHVERKSLQTARQQLEDLSRQMHDEVSETENLRKNLSVERMIVEGCDILLDVNQVFVRQGSLIQLPTESSKTSKGKRTFKNEKECLRQCYLFSNHLIVATRTTNGKLHLVPEIGKIALSDTLLIEDPSENPEDDESSICSISSQSSGLSETPPAASSVNNRDFKLIVEMKIGGIQAHSLRNEQVSVHLVAPTAQDKAAWISDLTQCLDNLQFNDMLRPAMSVNSSLSLKQAIKNDPKLFNDEADIRFSRTLNSCKVPQIRYATPERLLQRLTDLRFLSIDFLNTFLLTYRVFTDGATVLDALKRIYYNIDPEQRGSLMSLELYSVKDDKTLHLREERRRSSASPRRTSGSSSVSGYGSENERDRSHSYDSQGHRLWKSTLPKYDEEGSETQVIEKKPARLPRKSLARPLKTDMLTPSTQKSVSIRVERSVESHCYLSIPKVTASSSSETLTDVTVLSAPCSPSNLSAITLIGSPNSDSSDTQSAAADIAPTEKLRPSILTPARTKVVVKADVHRTNTGQEKKVERGTTEEGATGELRVLYSQSHRASSSLAGPTSPQTNAVLQNFYGSRRSVHESDGSIRPSFQHDASQRPSKAGVVITSCRQSNRRSSSTSAAIAFAIATCASSNPRDLSPLTMGDGTETADELLAMERMRFKESIISTACTMRVINVLRHWIAKHSQDFETNEKLRKTAVHFLDDIIYSPNLQPVEHKAAGQLRRILSEHDHGAARAKMLAVLNTPTMRTQESIETLSALEICEQMTYIDHQIFLSISCEEFLGQAWMKSDKSIRAPYIDQMTRRFNHVSNLVSSEILARQSMPARVAAIEKWAAVADISRCLHNYNGILQVCSAFSSSAVYRLRKTWDKVSKTTMQTVNKLQSIVSSDGRFRSLREALHRSDPPCIPYLGLYLTDLSFIEEGTPNYTEDKLLNFSKMRMISHIIREIRHFQQTTYKITAVPRVINYLVDPSILLDEDEQYSLSLELEPRTKAGQAPAAPEPASSKKN